METPNEEPTKKDTRATIKVCLGGKCCAKGGEEVYQNLKDGLTPEEAIVLPVHECFGYCEDGPNIAINDNIVKGIKPFHAVEQVREALEDTSCKADGLGSKSIDELDHVLDELSSL